jgi:hypothetical protein
MEARLPPPPMVMLHLDLTALMPFGAYVDAVAGAFRMHAIPASAAEDLKTRGTR